MPIFKAKIGRVKIKYGISVEYYHDEKREYHYYRDRTINGKDKVVCNSLMPEASREEYIRILKFPPLVEETRAKMDKLMKS